MSTIVTGNGLRQASASGLEAVQVPFSEIPIIDFAPMWGEDAAAKAECAASLRRACIDVGFFYLANHGIDQKLIDDTFALGPEFFGLPLDEKMQVHVSKSSNHSGYTPLLGENTDVTGKGDLHEAYDIAAETTDLVEAASGEKTVYGTNIWPERPSHFRAQMRGYQTAMLKLSAKLFQAFALALDLPETYFDAMTDHPTNMMRLVYYPPQNGVIDEKQIGIGAHSDYECFTILAQQADISALQALNSAGEWISAPPIPGTFTVNIGDQMARWTNDVFASTIHRVINRTGRARQSIPFFCGSNAETVLTPIPSCVTKTNPAKYPPVTAGAYVLSRLQATYGHTETETT